MQNYSFFLFSQPTQDLLLKRHNLEIPYDLLFDSVVKHYEVFKNFDFDLNISEYEAIEQFLNNTGSYLAELFAIHEEYSYTFTHTCPSCQSLVSLDSHYQVNDNDENVYCSLVCSSKATLDHIQDILGNGEELDSEELLQIIENT